MSEDASTQTSEATTMPSTPDAKWVCRMSGLDEKGQLTGDLKEPITVGKKFHLACEGEPVTLNGSALFLELPKELKYSLRLLETRSLTETRAEFIATTWMTGQIDLKNPVLTDGMKRVDLGELSLRSESVLDPQTNPEGKPYGPWSPQHMAYPLYVWIALIAIFALAALIFYLGLRKSMRRKRLLAELEKHATALSPYNHFNKELRKLGRQSTLESNGADDGEGARQYFVDLDRSFRWFLARELIVPALDSSPREVVREVLKVDKGLHKEIKRDLHMALTELDKALRSSKKLSSEDAQQLAELCRGLADKVARARSR